MHEHRASGRRGLHAARAAILACATLVVSGCHFGFVEPRFDVRERKLLVIPLRDLTARVNQRWYGESARGDAVRRAFLEWAESQAVGIFLRGSAAEEIIRNVSQWLEERIRPRDWQRLLAGVDVDLVLLGRITEFRHKQPNDINIYRGSAKMEYELIDAVTGQTVYETPGEREVFYPRRDEVDIPFMDLDVANNIRKIEVGLQRELGARLGKGLYGYYE